MSEKRVTKKMVAEADARLERALDENLKMHESGMAAVSSLCRAVDEHCETVCDMEGQKKKDSALREAVREEEEEEHRRAQVERRRREQEETRVLPPPLPGII